MYKIQIKVLWLNKMTNFKDNSHITQSFFKNFSKELESARDIYVKRDFPEVRDIKSAYIVLEVLGEILISLKTFFDKYPSLDEDFTKEFGSYHELTHRERIFEICFVEDYLFPDKERCPFYVDEQFSAELVESYIIYLDERCRSLEDIHVKTEEVINEQFTLHLKLKNLPCHCVSCVSKYRSKIRDTAYSGFVEDVLDFEDWVDENVLAAPMREVSNRFYDLRKKIDTILHSTRYKLKRSSLNKLEADLKSLLKNKFSVDTEIGQAYLTRVKNLCSYELKSKGLRGDLVSDKGFDRFSNQMGLNLWRPESYLKREFTKLMKSVLSLKRKDISSQILTEHLGQFWVHSKARLSKRKIIYHMGPTNSGKTYYAVNALCLAPKGCYLAPLRLLASELYDTMNAKGVITTLLTGEEVIEHENATHTSSTIEMARLTEEFDCCVIDEIQMINDSQRGWAWTRALINIRAPEIHICGDPSVLELIQSIVALTGDELEIKTYERMTKLDVEKKPIVLNSLKKSDALIVFSRRNALKYKADLEDLGFKVSIVYGRLGPEVRREQARKFDSGETDVMVSTDAIAMGMNLPIKRIVFSTLSKFIDSKEHPLTDGHIKQISGRAGRFKRFPVGYITCLVKEKDGIKRLEKSRHVELDQKEYAMVGPDLDIFNQVNSALKINALPLLKLSEFLRLFNTMAFQKPFYCVDLKEMIEIAEMVEEADEKAQVLSTNENFGFTCAPVNLGLIEHVQYFVWIVNKYVGGQGISFEEIDVNSASIDYLETAIKCVELYQWLARHFQNKNFSFEEVLLQHNKRLAIERLNGLLSEKIIKSCSSCGGQLDPRSRFNICETCFSKRKSNRRPSFKSDKNKNTKVNKNRRSRAYKKSKNR